MAAKKISWHEMCEKMSAIPRPFFESRKIFLGENKTFDPSLTKQKNALNFHWQQTVWSYFIPTRRNLDFRERGSLKFELKDKTRALTRKLNKFLRNVLSTE